jgi:hypothetical protein
VWASFLFPDRKTRMGSVRHPRQLRSGGWTGEATVAGTVMQRILTALTIGLVRAVILAPFILMDESFVVDALDPRS